ncbi:MotA/TolQ/ExbB proton channel family protein [Nitrospirillum sp. BR 11164]|uniref:MotA/TolQ/ExbB proton channel family protein n=1 Tax=Nitrospirillum sp. BR 11164 TaxID=3104324 RepID=UPI002AFFDD06|nr:MotA/TolQ/ExbB proton channel family protein [Nitrospirillum sp. BR 11164]MEA1650565.1 MotA/TolQ/ExbB proton channel family protein [Nitrospirillum sp. BR 11164]
MTTRAFLCRRMARALTRHAVDTLPVHRAAWGEAMQAEVDGLDDDDGLLRWALGCVMVGYRERLSAIVSVSGAMIARMALLPVLLMGFYTLFGGQVGTLLRALPGSGLIVLAGAWAVTAIGRRRGEKGVFAAVRVAIAGPRQAKLSPRQLEDFLDQLATAVRQDDGFDLVRYHLRLPLGRSMFGAYPILMRDPHAYALLQAGLTGKLLVSVLEDVHKERLRPSQILHSYGDALTWVGLVATLMGFIKALEAINHPESFGHLLAGALVGAVFGLVCAKGIIRPLADITARGVEDDMSIYRRIAAALAAEAR